MESLSASKGLEDHQIESTTSKETPENTFSRGNELAQIGKHKEAIESFDKAISLKPKFPQAYNSKGLSLAVLGLHQEAIENFDMALLLQPNDELAYRNRGCSHAGLGNYAEAIKDMKTAQSLGKKVEPEDQKESSREVNINAEEKKSEEQPKMEHEAIYRAHSEVAFQVGESQSLDHTLIHLDKELIRYYNQAMIFAKTGFLSQAIVNCDKALGLKPDFAEAYTLKGVSLAALGKHYEAIQNYDKTISLKPGNSTAHNNRGLSLERLGRFGEALESYEKAILLEPREIAAYNNKGLIFRKLGKFKEAVECFEKAIEFNPKDISGYRNKGKCLEKLERYEEAIVLFEKVIQLRPDTSFGYAGKANCFACQGKYEEAIELYTKTIQIDPGQLNCYVAKAMLLTYLEKKEEAAETVEKLIALRPNSKLFQLNTSFNNKRKYEINTTGTVNPVALLLKDWPEFDPRTGQFILNVISTIYKEPPPEDTLPIENKNLVRSEEPEESSTVRVEPKNENQPPQESYPSGMNSAMHSEDLQYNPEESLFIGGKHVAVEEDSYQLRVGEGDNSLVKSSHGDNKTQTESM